MLFGKIKNKHNCFLIVVFVLLTTFTNAQSISLDQEWRTDLVRRKQLLNQLDSTISFLVHPLYDTVKKGKSFLHNKAYLNWLPFQLQQQYVTDIPFKLLDGPMLASSGYQVMASSGVFAKLGPLTIQLQPQWVNSQKIHFNQLFWGNSSIRLNAGAASIGISTENISWGPSVFNPLILSSHAPGFAHATFNSRRPLKTPIGNVEWQMIAAYLDPMNPKYQDLAEVASATAPGRRYLNSAIISYQPKWINGLSLGVTRVVQENESELKANQQWILLLNNVDRASDNNYETEQSRDQYAAFFLRYLMKASNAEFYMEWGRNDAFFNLRDAIQRLDHTRAYTLGIRKLFNVNEAKTKYWQLISENTRMQQPPSMPLLSGGSWYVHSRAIQGYTHLGEILGAPIGQGANAHTLRISKFNGLQQFGIQLDRVTQNGVYFEDNLAFTEPSKTKWVDFGLRILVDHPFKNFVISSSAAYKKSFNYQWNSNNDLNSFMFKLGIWFR